MIKHVVMWRFKAEAEGNNAEKNKSLVAQKLQELTNAINEIESLETGFDINRSEAAYDLVLITTHKNSDALRNYQQHPDHVEVAAFIGKVAQERVVVDFEY